MTQITTARYRRWMHGAACSALLLLAATAAEATGKPPKGGGGGGGSGCGTTAETTYAGRAYALEADINLAGLVQVPVGPISDTGELPATGGMKDAHFLQLNVGGGTPLAPAATVAASILDASTVGSGDTASSFAQTAGLNVTVLGALGTPLLDAKAGILQATSEVECVNGQAVPTSRHGANIIGLTLSIMGQSINVPAAAPPNTDLMSQLPPELAPLVSGQIVLNEQKTENGRAVVNALRIDITILGAAGEQATTVHLIVSHAEAGLNCGSTSEPCPCAVKDWVTGGGWITLPGGAKGTFGMVGGIKPNGLQGHLTYIDHGDSGPKVKGNTVTAYSGADSGTTTRTVTYACTVNGNPDSCMVTVSDNGEPGGGVDGFTLMSGAYSASGPFITKGNIQLHKPKSCPAEGGGGGGGGGGKGGGKPR